jgi:type II secretory pathway predicted ATPase ExeA
MTKTRPRTDLYRSRFGLRHHPLPRDAAGPSLFNRIAGITRLERYFQDLLDEPGLGVLTAAPGVGKTAAIRSLCASLPEPDFKVVYLCDTAVTACDLYRTLALELGLQPAHRRAQLWWELKRTIVHMVEQQHTLPVLIIDEAQQLSDDFLGDLGGFLNFAFDRKTLLTLWLVGLPQLTTRLRMRHHAPLASRIVAQVQLEPLGREDFTALIEHGLKAAGARDKVLTDNALEMLWRASTGVPRAASRLLRAALGQAHDLNRNLVDEQALAAAIDELTPPKETKP